MKHNGNVSVVENRLETESGLEPRPPPPAQPGSDVTISVVNKQGDGGTSQAFRGAVKVSEGLPG